MENKTLIDELTEDVIWMSMRFWMNREDSPLCSDDYPNVLVKRFWGKLGDNGRSRLINDVEREIKYSFNKTNNERLKRLHNVLTQATIDYETNPNDFCEEYAVLDDKDFTMLRMAILYACPRMTIASSSLPLNIIQNRYVLFFNHHMETIINDLNEYLNWKEKIDGKRCFGDERIDDKTWKKFLAFLDKKTHKEIVGVDHETYNVFLCDGVHYSIGRYIENPYIDCFIDEENILPA